MIKQYEDCSPEEKADFDRIMKEAREKEMAWFASWGFVGAPVIAAGLAYQEFLEKETRENPHNFYKSPLARKSFMIGWMRAKL